MGKNEKSTEARGTAPAKEETGKSMGWLGQWWWKRLDIHIGLECQCEALGGSPEGTGWEHSSERAGEDRVSAEGRKASSAAGAGEASREALNWEVVPSLTLSFPAGLPPSARPLHFTCF